MKAVSIIIPTFKPGLYIFQCLESIKRQTYKEDLEVIIVLNGIRDPFFDDISDYISNNHVFSLYFTPLKGVSSARNLGLSVSSGKYIMFIDDDDYVNETYVEDLLCKATDSSLVLSNVKGFLDNCDGVFIDDYLSSPFELNKKNISVFEAKSAFSSSCAKLIPRSSINNITFPCDISIGEDAFFMFKVSSSIRNIELSHSSLYFRRIRKDSVSKKKYSFIYLLENRCLLIRYYTIYYIHNFHNIRFSFFVNRICAILKGFVTLKCKS